MRKTIIMIAAAATSLFAFSGVAQAQSYNYSFDSGSFFNLTATNTYSATGGFTFDAGTNLISNVTYSPVQTGSGPTGPFNFTVGTADSLTQVTFSGDGFGDFNTYFFAQSLALGGTSAITGGSFLGTNISAGGSVTAATAAVPEPATWAMMLIGFGGVGVAMRRKRNLIRAQIA